MDKPCSSNMVDYDDTETVKCEDSSFSTVASDELWSTDHFEPVVINREQINRDFKWLRFHLGIVVWQDRRISDGILTGYRVWKFCADEQCPCEIRLDTEKVLELGQWIKFKNNAKNIWDRLIDSDSDWDLQTAMFHTIPININPASPQILIECQIVVKRSRRFDVNSKRQLYLDDAVRRAQRRELTPFIVKIRDPQKLILAEHLGKQPWAILEYEQRWNEDAELGGAWNVVFIRPACYGEMITD